MMNRKAASGVDGESTEQFASEMEERVEEICKAEGRRVPGATGATGRYSEGRTAARDRWAFRRGLHNAPCSIWVWGW